MTSIPENRGDTLDPPFDLSMDHYARVVSAAPLVTFSLTNSKLPAGIATAAYDVLEGRTALHLLHEGWTLDHGRATILAEGVRRAQAAVPDQHFLILAANDAEVLVCAEVGLPAIVGNGLIFTDENVWYPRPPTPGALQYDAVYVARLEKWKRHELAAAVENLLLVYSPSLQPTTDAEADRVRALLPRAHFANHDGQPGYRQLGHHDVGLLLAQSRVGLCLSAVEGCMRASMEYLFCGLPIVSTNSEGGRDRYLGAGYCRVVEPDPEAVGRAVQELGSLNLDRRRIREHIGQVIAFERYNFLLAINRHAGKLFGRSEDVFPNFSPFFGAISSYSPLRNLLADLSKVVGQL